MGTALRGSTVQLMLPTEASHLPPPSRRSALGTGQAGAEDWGSTDQGEEQLWPAWVVFCGPSK